MQTRIHNLLGLTVALVLIAQMTMPVVALADITMRCTGANPTSAPCARVLATASDVQSGRAYGRLMACCKCRMMTCGAMSKAPKPCAKMAASSNAAQHSARATSPKCIFAVRSATVPATSVSQTGHKWLLFASLRNGTASQWQILDRLQMSTHRFALQRDKAIILGA